MAGEGCQDAVQDGAGAAEVVLSDLGAQVVSPDALGLLDRGQSGAAGSGEAQKLGAEVGGVGFVDSQAFLLEHIGDALDALPGQTQRPGSGSGRKSPRGSS